MISQEYRLIGPGWPLLLAALFVITACGQESPDAPVRGSASDTLQVQEESPAHSDEEEGHEEEGGRTRVTLSDTAMMAAGIRIDTVKVGSAAADRSLVVPGQVQFDPRRVALVSPRVPGRVERLTVVEGDAVRSGQVVALLYSAEFVTAQTDFLQATRRAGLLAQTGDSAGAAALAEAAHRRLRLLGLTDTAIARLTAGAAPADFLPLLSPLTGAIAEAHVLPGAAVEPGSPVFRVADLSVMDVVAEVPEQSVPLVRIGQAASVTIAAYPGTNFAGEVERMSGELNPETRTVQAVVHVPNRRQQLRAGMFATVRLVGTSPGRESASVVIVPESAVVTEGERRFVFVEIGPRTFERREVGVGSLTPPGSMTPVAGRVAVQRGLAAGEKVVVEGAFTLKSELAKASLGEHGH